MWPAGDEERRRRLIGEMDKSLVRSAAVLDPTAGSGEDQAIDLVLALKLASLRFPVQGFISIAAALLLQQQTLSTAAPALPLTIYMRPPWFQHQTTA